MAVQRGFWHLSAVNTGEYIEPGKTAPFRRPPERLIANPKARLREQFREVCRFKHLSSRTEEAYWGWVRRFLIFSKQDGQWRHPRDLGAAAVQAFLTDLATRGKVAASTQNQALNALVFLYAEVWERPWRRAWCLSAPRGRSACR